MDGVHLMTIRGELMPESPSICASGVSTTRTCVREREKEQTQEMVEKNRQTARECKQCTHAG